MNGEQRINIVQGEYHVSAKQNVVITTLLGSCVAACMHDPVAGIGGMNHFLLPGNDGNSAAACRYGVHLMELLVNGLLLQGASRERLQAKLFGGARTLKGLSDIGEANGRFAREFLGREGIAYMGGSLGGEVGRRLHFWPATARARQIYMSKNDELPFVVLKPAVLPESSGELELF